MEFKNPPRTTNPDGKTRQVGFELEFAGLKLDEVAGLVVDQFGGEIDKKQKSYIEILGTEFGDFAVEIDAAFLKNKEYKKILKDVGITLEDVDSGNKLENFLVDSAALVVPSEIVFPPIPLDRLDVVETLRETLHMHKAKGTKASMLYAFGMQMNPEVPVFEAEEILSYLQAFILLYDWIVEESQIDLTRRILPYINPFSSDYSEMVIEPNYRPGLDQLIDDYLEHNPTRNRPLDMLPLFAFLEEGRVLDKAEEPDLIKKRPTFHYRLPNCLIDDPSWTIAREWNYWIEIERLADSREKIREMSRDYLSTKESFFEFFLKKWPEKVRKWLS